MAWGAGQWQGWRGTGSSSGWHGSFGGSATGVAGAPWRAGRGEPAVAASGRSAASAAAQEEGGIARGRSTVRTFGPPATGAASSSAPAGAVPFQKWRCDRGRWVNVAAEAGKALVTLLRHDNRGELRGQMDPEGWVPVSALMETLTMRRMGLPVGHVRDVVHEENKSKTRFLMKEVEGELYLKAAQGHSRPELNYDLVLDRIKPGDEGWVDRSSTARAWIGGLLSWSMAWLQDKRQSKGRPAMHGSTCTWWRKSTSAERQQVSGAARRPLSKSTSWRSIRLAE